MKSIWCLAERFCDTTDHFGPWGAQGFFWGPGPSNNPIIQVKNSNHARLVPQSNKSTTIKTTKVPQSNKQMNWHALLSYGFPMVFLLFSYCCPMVFPCFPLVFLWFSYGSSLGPPWALPGPSLASLGLLGPPWALPGPTLGLPWAPWALPGTPSP